jgi:hypothetical protein
MQLDLEVVSRWESGLGPNMARVLINHVKLFIIYSPKEI